MKINQLASPMTIKILIKVIGNLWLYMNFVSLSKISVFISFINYCFVLVQRAHTNMHFFFINISHIPVIDTYKECVQQKRNQPHKATERNLIMK